jgi:hypothetical protein
MTVRRNGAEDGTLKTRMGFLIRGAGCTMAWAGSGREWRSQSVFQLTHFFRNGRTCSGHPRLECTKDVDARDKPGHDEL